MFSPFPQLQRQDSEKLLKPKCLGSPGVLHPHSHFHSPPSSFTLTHKDTAIYCKQKAPN